MPELPEVETVRKGLNNLIVNKTIDLIDYDWKKSLKIGPKTIDSFVKGATVKDIRRRGKLIIIDLSSEHSILIHLRMTGQLVFRSKEHNFGAGHPNDSLIGDLPDKSTRVIFTFHDQSKLYFNDQRKFGWVDIEKTADVDKITFLSSMGPEPLSDDFTFSVFKEIMKRKSNSMIKAALLDQKVIAGIGNIYADESLWTAKIHPDKKISSISTKKLKALYDSIREVLNLSIEKGGSTDRNYVNAEGARGSYIDFANVFRKENQPCNRCGTIIIKIRAAGRGTHLCPKCQKL